MISLLLPLSAFGDSWQRVVNGICDDDTMAVYFGGLARQKPAFCDLDNDGDLDMFLGEWDGVLRYFENTGTVTNPKFEFVTDFFDSINVKWDMNRGYSAPAFVDIDYDEDFDLYCGDYLGKTHIYENTGTVSSPHFSFIDTLQFPRVRHSCPAFYDVDSDGDLDMWLGGESGAATRYFLNTGNSANPIWEYDTNAYIPDISFAQVSPAFCDIDNDGDFDLFVGDLNGHIEFYENKGTFPDSGTWAFVTDFYDSITGYNRSGPAFVDINNDGKLELFLGAMDGLMRFYENVGTANSADFNLVTDQYAYLDFGNFSVPTFADIDKDGNLDMYIGTDDGMVRKLKNAGQDNWIYETRNYGGVKAGKDTTVIDSFHLQYGFIDTIKVGTYAAPAFADLNGDGRLELFVGNYDGVIYAYGNTGTDSIPVWTLLSTNYSSIDVGAHAKPTFWDIDKDNDYDLFVGNDSGKICFYRNDGNSVIPNFTFITDNCLGTILPGYTAPTFGDAANIDGTSGTILLVGVGYGTGVDSATGGHIYCYKGDSTGINWVRDTTDTVLNKIDVGRNSTPMLVDIDGDSDLDLFIGEGDGGVNFWKNLLVGVEEKQVTLNKTKLEMLQNPSLGTIRISYTLATRSNVSLDIYDLTGRCIKTLLNNKQKPAGRYTVHLENGLIPAGTYFARLHSVSNGKTENIVKKLTLVR